MTIAHFTAVLLLGSPEYNSNSTTHEYLIRLLQGGGKAVMSVGAGYLGMQLGRWYAVHNLSEKE